MPKFSKVDLHTHTTASDGDLFPEELVNLAFKNGIRILSVTDHDTVDGLKAAEKAAEKSGIRFIPGMEISAMSKSELHILGYYIEKENSEFQKGIDVLVDYREKREEMTIDYLNSKGVEITLDEVKKATKGNIIGRPHMAAVMITKGYVSNKKEAFKKYIGTPEFMLLERPKPTVKESIDIIKRGNGVPVLAHPHSLGLTFSQLDITLRELKELGLRGIECYYNSYTVQDSVNYLQLAVKHGLLPTGGSDYHGPFTKPDVVIGSGKKGLLNYNDLDIADKLFRIKY